LKKLSEEICIIANLLSKNYKWVNCSFLLFSGLGSGFSSSGCSLGVNSSLNSSLGGGLSSSLGCDFSGNWFSLSSSLGSSGTSGLGGSSTSGLGSSSTSGLGSSSSGGGFSSSSGSGLSSGLGLGSEGLIIMFVFVMGSLFLDVLGEDLFILGLGLLFLLVSLLLLLLVDSLSSESLLSDESLYFRGFVEGLVTFLDFSPDNVLSDIILLPESEHLSDVVGSLGSESSWLVTISNTLNLTFSLLGDLKSNHSKIGSTDAASY
jgi:hypothetical protein